MKKNTMMRIASVLLVAVLITTCAISGTFAKYVSTVNGESTARVAKWAFKAGSEDIDLTTTKKFAFALFESVDDENVKEGVDENIIAPGTTGSVSVALINVGEVNASYSVDFTVTLDEAGIPLQWSTNGSTWVNDLSDLTAVAGNLDFDDADGETITLYWKWAIESDAVVGTDQDNDIDTALGIDGEAEVVVTAAVTITQKD